MKSPTLYSSSLWRDWAQNTALQYCRNSKRAWQQNAKYKIRNTSTESNLQAHTQLIQLTGCDDNVNQTVKYNRLLT